MKWSYLNYAAVKLNTKVDHNLEGGYYRVPRLPLQYVFSTVHYRTCIFLLLVKVLNQYFNVYFCLNSIHTFTIVQNVNTFATHTSKSF